MYILCSLIIAFLGYYQEYAIRRSGEEVTRRSKSSDSRSVKQIGSKADVCSLLNSSKFFLCFQTWTITWMKWREITRLRFWWKTLKRASANWIWWVGFAVSSRKAFKRRTPFLCGGMHVSKQCTEQIYRLLKHLSTGNFYTSTRYMTNTAAWKLTCSVSVIIQCLRQLFRSLWSHPECYAWESEDVLCMRFFIRLTGVESSDSSDSYLFHSIICCSQSVLLSSRTAGFEKTEKSNCAR